MIRGPTLFMTKEWENRGWIRKLGHVEAFAAQVSKNLVHGRRNRISVNPDRIDHFLIFVDFCGFSPNSLFLTGKKGGRNFGNNARNFKLG